MTRPRFRLQTLLVIVAIVAVLLVPIAASLDWLHDHNAWFSINGFTIRF